ncbi:MAG: hypothetical protein ACI3YK_02740 [Eubacteriales bacterium]
MKKNTEIKRDRLFETIKYDGDGRAIINMTVRDDSEFLSAFSINHTPVISDEVAVFIETATVSLPPKTPITLRIHSDCIDEDEKKIYPDAISEYYRRHYAANLREIRRNAILSILLALGGIGILFAIFLFSDYLSNSVWNEVIDIVAWVFLWEAVDLHFLESHALRAKRKRYLSFIGIKVEYYPNNTESIPGEKVSIVSENEHGI